MKKLVAYGRKLTLPLVLMTSIYAMLNISWKSSSIKPAFEPIQLLDGQLCSQLSRHFPDSIPPLVHWTTKDGRLPAKLAPIVRSWRRLLNSSVANTNRHSLKWHFMHWDDRQISELVSRHYPRLAAAYGKLVNGLERSDIGRLLVLHHVGGLYVDTDVELLRDPAPFLRPSQLSGVGLSPNFHCNYAVWSQEPPEHAAFTFNRPSLISNAVMMTRANHSFLSFVIENWPTWFETNWAKKTQRSHHDAVLVTGPIMLQTFYDKYTALQPGDRPVEDWCGNLLAEADAFQPLWDVMYIPQRLKTLCSVQASKLNNLQQQHCRRLNVTKFETKRIPNSSYTVHRFMHLSYTHSIQVSDESRMPSLLPFLKCKL